MTERSTPVRLPLAHELRDFLARERQRILDTCTSCGKCSEVCPMTPYNEKKGAAQAKDLAAGVLQLLRTGATDEASLGWVKACIRSGCCVPACPENVNPKLMMRIGKMIATGGLGGAKLIPVKQDPDYYARIRAFARLQLSDDEYKRWME